MTWREVSDKSISAVAERVIRRHRRALDKLGDVVRSEPAETYMWGEVLCIKPKYASGDTTADWGKIEEGYNE